MNRHSWTSGVILILVFFVSGGCDTSNSSPNDAESVVSTPPPTPSEQDSSTPPEANPEPSTNAPPMDTGFDRAMYAYQLLLDEIVTPQGLVRYDRFSEGDRVMRIGLVVREFKEAALPEEKNDKLAFLCNAYNANVLFIAMMERVKPGFTSVIDVDGFFDRLPITVAAEPMYLNFLENERIRPLGDPRVHAALVCAALSCPPLRIERYRGDELDRQLDDQCRRWVNDTARNRIVNGKLQLSEIFNWYGEDFNVEPYGGVVGFLRHYAEPGGELAIFLESHSHPTIEWMKYDWSLNQAPPG